MRIIQIILITGLVFFQSLIGQEEEKYYRLHSLWIEPAQMQVFDANNDGIDEVYRRSNEVQIDILDWTNLKHHTSFFFKNDKNVKISPIPGHSLESLYFLFEYQESDTVANYIYSRKTRDIGLTETEIQFDSVFITKNPYAKLKSDKSIYNLPNLAITNDSSNYFILNTAYDQHAQRGVLKAHVPSATIQWKYLFGPHAYSIVPNELQKMLLVGTYAPSNGLSYNGTHDDSSYAFVLTDTGKLLWKKSFGGSFSGTYVTSGDFWGDGSRQILVAKYGPNSKTQERDELYLFSSDSWEIIQQCQVGNKMSFTYGILTQQFCHDFDGDGKDEFVVGNSDGFVRIFDGDLEAERISPPFEKPINVSFVADINNDNRKEVVCYINSDRIIILNNNLKFLYEYSIRGRNVSELLPFHRERDILLFLRSSLPDQPAFYELFQFEESKFPFPSVNSGSKTIRYYLPIFLIIIIVVLFLTRKSLLLHSFYHLLQQAQIFDQSLILTKSMRIKSVGSKWVDILNNRSDSLVGKKLAQINSTNMPLVNLLAEMINSKQGERLFSATIDGEAKPIRIYVRFLPALRMYNFMVFDITVQDHIKQVQMWAKVAQKLAHGIKNPLTSVKLNAEELREYLKEKCLLEEDEVSDYIQSITSQVDKLKRMSDGFMRFVEFEKPELKPYDLNTVVSELVAQWKPADISAIRVNLDLAPDLPPALLDKQQFIYGFQNIFYNAMDSLDGKGHIDISTRIVHGIAELGSHKIAYIDLRIQDTGCGIPPEYLEKITQPYFTTKKDGTGLGLSIVEKIIDSHNGSIDIQSSLNEGTTVTLRLQTKHV